MLPLTGTMLLVLMVVFCSGCPAPLKGYPNMSYNLVEELNALKDYNSPKVITTYNNFGENKAGKKAFRNEVVYARKRAIDLNFATFQKNVYKQLAVGGIGADWAVLALTGATTVTPNAVLGGIAAGITGAKGKVSEHLFFNNTIPVLFSKMEAQRKEVFVRIATGLAKPEVDEYPLMEALDDLDDYYKAGTIPGALNGIVTTAGNQAAQARERLNRLRGVPPTEP